MNVGADACVVGSLCSVLSLFVCFFVCVRACRVIRKVVQVGIHALSMNRPSIYLSFHRDSFLFCFGAADTIVDRVATESAIAWQV